MDSADVNAYLQEISGQPFTAKDFRTWAGTVLASMALKEFETFDSEAAAKKNIVAAIERVAERLGNTPSVCRKCYVHPAILEAYISGSMLESLRHRAEDELKSENLHAAQARGGRRGRVVARASGGGRGGEVMGGMARGPLLGGERWRMQR